MLGLLLIILISIITTYIEHRIYPKAPGGFFVVFLIGVLGGLIGYMNVFSGIGPVIDKVNIFTSFIASTIFVFLYSAFARVLTN